MQERDRPRREELDERVVPLVEEELHVRREARETGRVRVSKRVETRVETVDEPLVAEAVEVERVPVGRVVTEAPPIRRERDHLVVPVVEERLTVRKELVLREEIHLRRRRERRRDTREIRLRRETADVERHETGSPPTPGGEQSTTTTPSEEVHHGKDDRRALRRPQHRRAGP